MGALSASVLSERVVGEESVDYHTPLLSMMTFKRSAESEAVRQTSHLCRAARLCWLFRLLC